MFMLLIEIQIYSLLAFGIYTARHRELKMCFTMEKLDFHKQLT